MCSRGNYYTSLHFVRQAFQYKRPSMTEHARKEIAFEHWKDDTHKSRSLWYFLSLIWTILLKINKDDTTQSLSLHPDSIFTVAHPYIAEVEKSSLHTQVDAQIRRSSLCWDFSDDLNRDWTTWHFQRLTFGTWFQSELGQHDISKIDFWKDISTRDWTTL